MYIFHYQLKIKDIGGMDCVGLLNPLLCTRYSEEKEGMETYSNDLKITKVEISSRGNIDVGLYAADILPIIVPEQNISGYIRNSDLGVREICDAIAYCEPVMVEPVTCLKSASIQDGNQRKLIDASDYLVLPPGQCLVVRGIPSNPFQVIHITIVFDEKERAII